VAVLFRALWNELFPPEYRRDIDLLRQANRVAGLHLAMLVWVPVFAAFYYGLGAPTCGTIICSGGVLLLGSLVLLHRGKSPSFCGHLLTAAAWYVYTSLALLTGGVGAPVTMWYATIPILAMLMCGQRAGFWWTSASALTITALALAREWGIDAYQEVSRAGLRFLDYTGLVGLLLCVYFLVKVLKKVEADFQESLHEANRSLELQATIDGLTGVANRRTFDRALEEEWKRHERTQGPLSVLMFDVDHFKQYNDELGHLAGDDCLRTIAQSVAGYLRRTGDVIARYGGEEFGVILPNTGEQSAVWVADQIRELVKSLEIPHPASTVSRFVTISVGVASTVPTRGGWCIDFLHDADVALYRAKGEGRNRTVLVETDELPAIEPALGTS
jgi:diguanylate cyclase (GGDEF)-like protein